MLEVLPDVGRVQERFGRDAADKEAASAESRLPFNERRFKAVLPGTHRCGISAWTAANYSDVVTHFRLKCNIQPYFSEVSRDIRILNSLSRTPKPVPQALRMMR